MIKTILVPLDGSPLAEAALPQAQRLAQRAGAAIVIVRAVHGGVMAPTAQSKALADAELYVKGVADGLASRGCPVRQETIVAEPTEGILLAALATKADVIVMSTHGLSGLRHALMGSVAEEVLQRANLPVLLVQPHHGAGQAPAPVEPFRTVLIPLDGTPGAERALLYIADQPFARGADILLLHSEVPVPVPGTTDGYAFVPAAGVYIPQEVVDEADRETEAHCRRAHAYLERVARVHLQGRTWLASVPLDDPASAIVRLAAEQRVDLIAMTTHARTGLARLAEGSVAAHVLHHAGVPVLLLRQTTGADAEPTPITAARTGMPS